MESDMDWLKWLKDTSFAMIDDDLNRYVDADAVAYYCAHIHDRARSCHEQLESVSDEVCHQALDAQRRARTGEDPMTVLREFRGALEGIFVAAEQDVSNRHVPFR